MPPQARDVLASDSAAAALERLRQQPSKEHRSIVRRILRLRSILKADCLHGEVVRKRSIPPSLRVKHRLGSLYVEDLPAFWRLLYTVMRDGQERYVIVVEIVDHKQYSKWFPGKRD